VLGQGYAEVVQVLLAVGGGVLRLCLGEVEGALEFSVVGVVVFVSDGLEVEVAAALV
jgi:hypothetical protein